MNEDPASNKDIQDPLIDEEETNSAQPNFLYKTWSLQDLVNRERKTRKNKKIVISLTSNICSDCPFQTNFL